MAVQILELLLDDLDGGDADETIRFAYDGVDYTIDLNTKNAAKLRRILSPYVDHGAKVGPSRKPRLRIEETAAGRDMIRTWARSTGRFPALAERGRVPRDVIDAYYESNRG